MLYRLILLRLLVLCLPGVPLAQFGTIKIDWNQGNGFATPTIDLTPHVEEHVDEDMPPEDDTPIEPIIFEPVEDIGTESAPADAATTTADAATSTTATTTDSLYRLVVSLGGVVSEGDDDTALRAVAEALVAKAKTKVVRKLLRERGRQCVGCAERQDYVDALLQALDAPIVAMSGLPLFHYGVPLYPHTRTQMHFFEGRYKLMVERALLGDHRFGFVAADGVGTVAHIDAWQMLDDGRSLVSVRGGERFTIERQWSEDCDGCTSGPLHHADVRLFNDTATHEEAEDPEAVALAATCNRLYHTLTSRTVREGLERTHGPQPSVAANGSYAASMWLSASCASYPPCATEAAALLKGVSTAERIRRIVAVQKKALRGLGGGGGKKASSRAADAADAGADATGTGSRGPPPRGGLRGVALRVGRSALGGGAPDQPATWHGKLLLLHPDGAGLSRAGHVVLLSHEPDAAPGVLRGLDMLTPAGVDLAAATRPEFRDDFDARLLRLPTFVGGDDDEGRCGFLALSTHREPLPHSRGVLGGELQLTDLQIDYAAKGSGPALVALTRALGTRQPPAVKMLMGCRAWPDLDELEQQLDMGLWRLVDVTEGATALAAALVRAQQAGTKEARELWGALWRISEEALAG